MDLVNADGILGFKPDTVDQDIDGLARDLIAPWINKCRHGHTKCAQLNKGDQSQFPTRLINVSDGGSVINTNEMDWGTNKPDYVILSYCWGERKRTAKNNDSIPAEWAISPLPEQRLKWRAKQRAEKEAQRRWERQWERLWERPRQELNEFSSYYLPKTIRDAIQLTQALGVRYLWVDALCILQECGTDPGDFKTEAPRMGSYYANTLCCIVASRAADSFDGFLTERRSMRFSRQPYVAKCPRGNYAISAPLLRPATSLRKAPTMQRGWCLQEWVLPTRVLYWTDIGLVCECREDVFYEGEVDNKIVFDKRTDIRHILEVPREEAFRTRWPFLVYDYSHRLLSKPEDGLTAVQGIASVLAAKHQEEYFAGVFRSYMAEGLVWRRSRRKLRHRQKRKENREGQGRPLPRFPTWSWASTDGVEFDEFMEKNTSLVRCVQPGRFPSMDEITSFDSPSSRLLRLAAPVVCLDGYQVVRGEQAGIWHINDSEQEGSFSGTSKYIVELDDEPDEFPEPQYVKLLVLMTIPEGWVVGRWNGLVVQKSKEDGADGMYERIGVAEVNRDVIANDLDDATITEIDLI